MSRLLWPLAAALCALAGPGIAQTAGGAPLYRSAFDGYRPWRAEEPGDWKRANDEMQRLGGHAGHLRGTALPAAPRPVPPSSPKVQDKPAPSGREAAPGGGDVNGHRGRGRQ